MVIEASSQLGMTGEREDSPQSSEEVANPVGKQRVQMIWTEEALKKIQNRTPKCTYTKKKFSTGKDCGIRSRCFLEASGKRTA